MKKIATSPPERIVEAYIGEYASGKSETAVNRALELLAAGRQVTLVDLRPIKRELEQQGLYVVAWETRETMGLGEAGSILKPEMRWALKRSGDIILDIGYGVAGARTLNLVEGAKELTELKVLAVINIGRPMTARINDIIEYAQTLGPLDGLTNNSHLGDETDVEFIQEGARVVTEAARILGLPVVATTAVASLAQIIGPVDCMGNLVRPLIRYMPRTFW